MDARRRGSAYIARLESKLKALEPPPLLARLSGWEYRWAWEGEPYRLHWPLALAQWGVSVAIVGLALSFVIRQRRWLASDAQT